MLAERSLPGSLIVDQTGRRFVNDRPTTCRSDSGFSSSIGPDSPGDVDVDHVRPEVPATATCSPRTVVPRMAVPESWYEAGIAHRSADLAELGRKMGVPELPVPWRRCLSSTRWQAAVSIPTSGRGNSAYDRYYGDPTVTPNQTCVRSITARSTRSDGPQRSGYLWWTARRRPELACSARTARRSTNSMRSATPRRTLSAPATPGPVRRLRQGLVFRLRRRARRRATRIED